MVTVTAPAGAAASTQAGRMSELFEEEGFNETVEAVCPSCGTGMKGGAVLCTKCGYNKETGARLTGHKTAGVDIDHGTMALMKAEEDMKRSQKVQDDLVGNVGMPWWMLALILFLIVSSVAIAVLAINSARRVDGAGTFNPIATFFILAGSATGVIAAGGYFMVLLTAFKKEMKQGWLSLFVPFYIFYFVSQNFKETWRFIGVAIVMGGISGGLFAAASSQM